MLKKVGRESQELGILISIFQIFQATTATTTSKKEDEKYLPAIISDKIIIVDKNANTSKPFTTTTAVPVDYTTTSRVEIAEESEIPAAAAKSALKANVLPSEIKYENSGGKNYIQGFPVLLFMIKVFLM